MPREHSEHPTPGAAAPSPETKLPPKEESMLDALGRVLEQLALVKTEIAAMKIPLDRLERSMAAWACLRAGREAPGPGAPSETDHG